jgi:hypothetical protein
VPCQPVRRAGCEQGVARTTGADRSRVRAPSAPCLRRVHPSPRPLAQVLASPLPDARAPGGDRTQSRARRARIHRTAPRTLVGTGSGCSCGAVHLPPIIPSLTTRGHYTARPAGLARELESNRPLTTKIQRLVDFVPSGARMLSKAPSIVLLFPLLDADTSARRAGPPVDIAARGRATAGRRGAYFVGRWGQDRGAVSTGTRTRTEGRRPIPRIFSGPNAKAASKTSSRFSGTAPNAKATSSPVRLHSRARLPRH